ncbi:MAG TPA: penicillin-insensitive murein endopeptidase [Polyangiaceae bacterium]|jgi:penicillin-insensitive murein endopeptidase|nr:penicillin-insensitive murein endopeptidase [Polyangiaceae bacterium]
MLVSIARVGLRRHAVSRAVVLAGAVVIGLVVRPGASVGEGHAQAAMSPAAPGGVRTGAAPNTEPAARALAVETKALGPVVLDAVDIRPAPNPLAGASAADLSRFALRPPASLGTVCFGRPNRGRLFNGVELRSEPGIHVMVADDNSYGTAESVRTLRAAVAELHAEYPGAPDLNVGDLSRARGGYMRPHRSHQLGVDADLGYFYRGEGKWYTKARADNLDRELTWAFLKALIAQGGVEYVFMDRSVQSLLRNYAMARGEDPAWLDTLFESPAHRDTLIRHAHGHITHFHVRFLDPAAQRVGRVLEGRLRRPGRR